MLRLNQMKLEMQKYQKMKLSEGNYLEIKKTHDPFVQV